MRWRSSAVIFVTRSLLLLVEDDGFAVVDEDAVVEVPADRPRKHHLFQVAALLKQILQPVAVGNSYDVLFDDRSLVQIRGDVMTGGADQLYSALEGRW